MKYEINKFSDGEIQYHTITRNGKQIFKTDMGYEEAVNMKECYESQDAYWAKHWDKMEKEGTTNSWQAFHKFL
jgi:hypothetical protein